eukprot:671616-Prymnesium_polylepis.1
MGREVLGEGVGRAVWAGNRGRGWAEQTTASETGVGCTDCERGEDKFKDKLEGQVGSGGEAVDGAHIDKRAQWLQCVHGKRIRALVLTGAARPIVCFMS